MAEPRPVELRKRVVWAYESGAGSYAAVAELFGVGEATVKRWTWQYRWEGTLLPRKKGGGNRSDICLEELEAIVEALGDANAGEITAEYNRGRCGKALRHVSSIKRTLRRADMWSKKNGYVRSNNSGPT